MVEEIGVGGWGVRERALQAEAMAQAKTNYWETAIV